MKVSIKHKKNDKKSLKRKTSRHISNGCTRTNVLNCHKSNGTKQNVLMVLNGLIFFMQNTVIYILLLFWGVKCDVL